MRNPFISRRRRQWQENIRTAARVLDAVSDEFKSTAEALEAEADERVSEGNPHAALLTEGQAQGYGLAAERLSRAARNLVREVGA